MSEPVRFPWGEGAPDPDQVYVVPLDLIKVPDPRVTSVFAPEQWQEFVASLKSEGQKDPVKLILVGTELWLEDGFNRLLGLRQLGIAQVKALVRAGTSADVQIGNIITARHRGRENPAQTAEVIRDLVDVEKMDPAVVQTRLGISKSWYARLYKIAHLPAEIKDLVKYGKLSATLAYHLCVLEDPVQQLEVATQASQWGYNEQQIRDRVRELLNPDYEPQPDGYTFNAGGRPEIVYPQCIFCGKELKEEKLYAWTCREDLELVRAAYKQMQAAEAPSPPSPPSPP